MSPKKSLKMRQVTSRTTTQALEIATRETVTMRTSPSPSPRKMTRTSKCRHRSWSIRLALTDSHSRLTRRTS